MHLDQQLHARRQHYGLDEATHASLREAWRLTAPVIETALAANLASAIQLPPPIGDIMRVHGAQIVSSTRDHLPILFGISPGSTGWIDSLTRTSDTELLLGLDSRHRAGINRFVQEAAAREIGRRYRFNGAKAARLCEAVQRLLLFDVACAVVFHSHRLQGAATARNLQLENAIAAFDATATGMRGSIGELVASLTTASGDLSDLSHTAGATIRGAAAASAGASSNAAQTANSTEELARSVAEIGDNVRRSVDLAGRAVTDAERANANVHALHSAVEQIGSVVGLIADIAAQTNLLALNATIEAARAGETGRGFAVVAAEVKTLAGQTSRATDEIRAHIGSIQEATRRSVEEISGIRQAVSDMAGSATTIAAAVHQQSAATEKIAEGAESTASYVRTLGVAINTVEVAVGHAGGTAKTVLDASQAVAGRAGELDEAMSMLFERVRAG